MRDLDAFPHETYEAIFALLILCRNIRADYRRWPTNGKQVRAGVLEVKSRRKRV